MFLAVLTVTVAQMLDLGTFVRMIALRGIDAETNPFVFRVVTDLGVPFIAVAKIAGLSLVIAVIVVLYGRGDRASHPRLAWTVATVAVAAGIVGGWSNANAIL